MATWAAVAGAPAGVSVLAVDAYLAVVSKRDVRRYSERPLSEDLVRRILDAGRVTGSAQNRQPWRFIVVQDGREQLARAVYEPGNVAGAALVVALAIHGRGPTGFDAGRVAQNMMLAAWNEGVGSCPNGIAEPEPLPDLLGLREDETVSIVLSFGYPARPVDPHSRTPEEWLERADRKSLEDVVSRT